MKQLRRSMRLVGVLLLAALIATGAWVGMTVYSQGSRWVIAQNNPRLNAAKKHMVMGSILDRAGEVLASTDADGNRVYAADKSERRALSQTVGDQMSMSGTGVETFHAGTLLGFSGSLVDRTWQFISGQDFKGDDIRLTVSAELSSYISQQFPKGKEGAVVLMNYKTGEILGMVSKPDYDPQAVQSRRTDADDSGSAYLNRCLQGQYTPGSVFKVVTLAAALENLPGVAKRTFTCTGPRMFGDSQVTCFGHIKHGDMNLMQAFAQSCNVTFAALAYEMQQNVLRAKAETMGFNFNFKFRDLVLYQSTIPDDIPSVGELAWTGVGQGKLLVTPLHMAMITSSIANGGMMREPQLIQQVIGAGGVPKLRAPAGNFARVMREDTAAAMQQYMRRAVESGTATQSKVKGYTVCGKTGSAETSNDKRKQTDAWYVGYIQEADAPFAIAIVIEQGGTGGGAAAPLAAKAFKKAIALGLN